MVIIHNLVSVVGILECEICLVFTFAYLVCSIFFYKWYETQFYSVHRDDFNPTHII